MSEVGRILTSSIPNDEHESELLRPLARALIELAIQLFEDKDQDLVNEEIEEAA